MNICSNLLRLTTLLISLSLFSTTAHAIKWTKLKSNKDETLLIDKESIALQNNLKKAWLKITYTKPQKNAVEPDKKYNLSKVLWYFNCAEQKSATSQVAQYMGKEMVYSAGIDVKKAEFIDPVPETDVDVAMRFTCAYDRAAEEAKIADAIAAKKAAKAAKKKAAEDKILADKLAFEAEEKEHAEMKAAEEEALAKATAEEEEEAGHNKGKKDNHKKKPKKKGKWSYAGDTGPKHWEALKDEFKTCGAGVNQSPINIKSTIKAKLGKIRNIRKYPATHILNNGHAIQANFGFGNMMVLDEAPYQLKSVEFHTPSEHTLDGKSYPIEAQFTHADSKGVTTMISVMFKEGKANKAIGKLWLQLSKRKSRKGKKLNTRVLAKDLMPTKPDYYRYNGSLTTPPCTEGVKWLVLKTALSASTEQIEKLEKVLKHTNNRPVQALNGRVVLE
jgi:carbonic anhydrase